MASDTIAAIATAPGRGGVAVVRVSGPEAFAVARAVTGREPEPGRVAFVRFRSPTGQQAHDNKRATVACCRGLVVPTGRVIDSGLLIAFKAPHSYTGEDVVEFQCHGGSVSPRRVVDACFAAGARLARRGEFTERAFLNGKMDLSESEAVIELVDAKTDRAADDALARLGGAKKNAYRDLYREALELSATLEHALDVDEGDLPDAFFADMAAKFAHVRDALAAAAASATAGRLLREGALVVLAGAPNAGKSSLLNALVGESRAIVSETPGTTRDAVEVWLDIGGWPVRLVDTAGLRDTTDAIEREGVHRAEDLVVRADLVLALAEPGVAFPAVDAAKALFVRTKGDLGASVGGDGGQQAHDNKECALVVSARTGEGLEELRDAVAGGLAARAGAASDGSATVSERERSLLTEATRALGDAAPADPVLAANAARACADTLGRLVGAEYSSDLLDTLFSRFCVGK